MLWSVFVPSFAVNSGALFNYSSTPKLLSQQQRTTHQQSGDVSKRRPAQNKFCYRFDAISKFWGVLCSRSRKTVFCLNLRVNHSVLCISQTSCSFWAAASESQPQKCENFEFPLKLFKKKKKIKKNHRLVIDRDFINDLLLLYFLFILFLPPQPQLDFLSEFYQHRLYHSSVYPHRLYCSAGRDEEKKK